MIQDLSITLAAGERKTVNTPRTANVFACTAATADFLVRPNNENYKRMKAGRRFGSEISKATFHHLTFHNDSAASNTIHYTIADEEISFEAQVDAVTSVVSSAISNEITTCIAATPSQLLKTMLAADAPSPLAAVQTYFRKAIVYGVNTLAGVANTGSVYIGPSAAANQQPIEIAPGAEYVLEPPNGAKWNLADWYLDVGTNGDGVVVIYT